MENGFWNRMTKEAIDELASGDVSWKELPTNTLIMACFGLLSNHLTHKITKPLWFFASSVATGVVAYIVTLIF